MAIMTRFIIQCSFPQYINFISILFTYMDIFDKLLLNLSTLMALNFIYEDAAGIGTYYFLKSI